MLKIIGCCRMWCVVCFFLMTFFETATVSAKSITIHADQPGITISPTLYGIFFEDINWAADGGLYAEMVQNRSFEYIDVFGSRFNAMTAWTVVRRGGGSATANVVMASPLNSVNTHYFEMVIANSGSGVGLSNEGFGGIAVTDGATYFASLWIRVPGEQPVPVRVSIEKPDGTVLGSVTFDSTTAAWKKFSSSITVSATETAARLVVTALGTGTVDLDMISLFPEKTFKNRENGLRADLAQRLVDMHPKFVRFPGGCIVHSNNIATAYRWKTTIGPVEQRRYNPNRWGYMQSGGLGFFEYFQLCEDLGAIPIPILPCGVACHFKTPYEVVPLGELQPWIDDALDLIEYANGPVSSTWGAKRAEAGHPEPFNLRYIGIGNEEWGPEFKERSTLFIKAVREKYPDIDIVGTSGPYADGTDFTDLWNYVRAEKIELVDEHYYKETTWFLDNTTRYDNYDRNGPEVFAGEYASRSPVQKTLANAIAEAAFMTGLERNSDIVSLSSYAPLFCNLQCNGAPAEGPWNPDLIYFDHYRSYGTPSYHVQVMFGANVGQRILKTDVSSGNKGPLYTVTSLDTVSGDLILKVVNSGSGAESCTLHVEGTGTLGGTGTVTVLTSESVNDLNTIGQPEAVAPVTSKLANVAPMFTHRFPANSVSVIRVKTGLSRVKRNLSPVVAGTPAVAMVSSGGFPVVLRLSVQERCRCTVRCISPGGQVVATVADRYVSPGTISLHWNGSTSGKPLVPGMYYMAVTMGGRRASLHPFVIIR